MLGCSYGILFKTTVAGGSYQEGLSINIQGVPPGYYFKEEEIYTELMLRKPGQGELTSPRSRKGFREATGREIPWHERPSGYTCNSYT